MIEAPPDLEDIVQKVRLKAIPRLQQFLDEVSAILSAGGSFLDDCEAPFRSLLQDRRFVPDLVHYELEKLNEMAAHTIPRANENSFTVALTKHGRLVLRLLEPSPEPPQDPERLIGIARNTLLGVHGPGRIVTARYAEDPGKPMKYSGTEETGPGDVKKYVAGRDLIHSWLVDQPSVWLTFIEGKTRPTYWVYDFRTGAPVRQHAATSDTPRLEFAARLLSELQYAPAAPAIAGLYEHPDHYIRWAALRQLARLDRDRALALLETAKSDPHPHVRTAATAALARFHGEAS